MMDVEGTSDVFIKAFFKDDEKKMTEIHWRCQDGRASFNYRLLLPTSNNPDDPTELEIQIWDKDIVMSDDKIGHTKLDIKKLIEDCILTSKPQSFNK